MFNTMMNKFSELASDPENDYALDTTGKSSTGELFRVITNPSIQAEDIEYNKALFWSKLAEMNVYVDELRPAIEGVGNKLINSTAGAGKTTCINLELCYEIITGQYLRIAQFNDGDGAVSYAYIPRKYLVVTFLKSGAEDIKIRFLEWANKLGITVPNLPQMRFSTIHSEVYAAIRALGVNIKIMETPKVDDMIKSLMKQFGVHSLSSKSKNITYDEVKDIVSLLGYVRNTLDGKKYTHQLISEYTIDEDTIALILQQFKLRKQSIEEMDYEDIQEMLYEALTFNPNVVEFIVNRYDRVIVDEFQDTSQLQYALLRYYFAGQKYVTVVGDDDQTIYSFRGSDIDIILNKFNQDLNPTIYTLNTNFRCGENILNAVIPSITKNTKRYPKEIKAYNKGGIVQVMYLKEMGKIMEEVRKDVLNGTVGIIARVNTDLVAAAILLEIEGGIPFKVSKGVSLRKGLAQKIIAISELVLNRYTDNFESILKMFLPYSNWKEATMLSRILQMNNELSIYNIDKENLIESVPYLYNNLLQYIRAFKENKQEDEAYIFLLEYLEKVIYTKDTPYHVKSKEFIYFIKELFTQHPLVKDYSLESFHILLNTTLPSKIDKRTRVESHTSLVLTTAHEAKGKEWDSVYIWNNVEGTFPVQLNRDMTDDEFEEERRVHFIAWTRAKRKLTVITQQGRESVFLKECVIGDNQQEVNDEQNIVYRKPIENPAMHISIPNLLTAYRNHINTLDLSDSENFARYSSFNTAVAEYTYEGVIEEISNDYKYSSRLMVKELSDVIEAFDKIFEELVNSIRHR